MLIQMAVQLTIRGRWRRHLEIDVRQPEDGHFRTATRNESAFGNLDTQHPFKPGHSSVQIRHHERHVMNAIDGCRSYRLTILSGHDVSPFKDSENEWSNLTREVFPFIAITDGLSG